jgi:DMSO/TMAO reductase YedYZ heme-binding membrane subunit
MRHPDIHPTDISPSRLRPLVAGALAAALGYAVLRYLIAGSTPPAQLPMFVLNKALAVASVLLVAGCLAIGPLVRLRRLDAAWIRDRKGLGVAGFAFGALHSVMTLAMMSPAVYAKLYDGAGRYTAVGGLAVLAGIVTLAALIAPALTSLAGIRGAMKPSDWRGAQQLAIVGLGAVGVHLVALGLPSWLAPEKWPAGLPPLTLVAFAPVALSLGLRLAAGVRRRARRAGAAAVTELRAA